MYFLYRCLKSLQKGSAISKWPYTNFEVESQAVELEIYIEHMLLYDLNNLKRMQILRT